VRSYAQPSPQSAKLDEACAALCATRCSELTATVETAEANLSFPIADASLQLALVFTVGPTNTSRCIQGSEPIRSESACKAAAVAMGLPFEDVIEAGPSGCHMTEDGVFFNPLDQGAPHASSSPICTPVRPNARRTARSLGATSAPNEPQPGDWSVVRDSGTSKPTAPTPPSLEEPTSDDAFLSPGKTQPSAAARQLLATPKPTSVPTRNPTSSPTFAPLAPTTRAPGAQKQVEELSYDPATNPSFDAWLRPLLNKPWAVVVNLPPNQQLTLASLSISDVANPYFDLTLRCSDTTLSTNLTVTNPIKLTQSSSKLRVERVNLVQESKPSACTAHMPQ
jgi:hypothetical protein